MKNPCHVLLLLIVCFLKPVTGIAQGTFFLSTSWWGGPHKRGAIYKAENYGATFQPIHICDSTGSALKGNMVQAANGFIYGVSANGGYDESGVVFCLNPVTYAFTKIHDFGVSVDSGQGAVAGLTKAPDGLLYGVAQYGGDTLNGVIYTINPANNTYNVAAHFGPVRGLNSATGLILHSNGRLYGTTSNGGTNGWGTIFSFDPVTAKFEVLYNFSQASGCYPRGRLLEVKSGRMIGTTTYGGAYNGGGVFSIDTIVNSYNVLSNFGPLVGTIPPITYCVDPRSDLVMAGDGYIYGTTAEGGMNGNGTIYRINPNTGYDSLMYSFTDADGHLICTGLTRASDDMLYGVVYLGGPTDGGTVFRYDYHNDVYTKLHDFDTLIGGDPYGDILEIDTSLTPTVTGIPSLLSESFNIYPNPASTLVNISIPENLIGSTLTVTDITGRRMNSALLSTVNRELSTEGLANGIYFLSISKEGKVFSQKLVVQR